ncbi:thioredoxin family protein [Leptolyngbya sp. O-77]|uniref:thioredoxin family protein n=1 Tax=Leptolyngbya sp. O-77 TaxID=1080068 RepID=UPI00074D4ABA|nr:thioredoxin domain-containing protein [Leptolyngbya sp. O-77]BAU40360.1 Thioredoxin-1 [Leptolyngbya sp. O-77]
MLLSVNESNFSKEVLESSTPVLINFWAPWCGLCRLMNPMLNQLQAEWRGQIKLVTINADENFKLANTYRLTTLPTLLLVEGDRVLHRFDHFASRDDIRNASESFHAVLASLLGSYSYTA